MGRVRASLVLVAATAAIAAVAAGRHFRGTAGAHGSRAGTLMGDAATYDTVTRLALQTQVVLQGRRRRCRGRGSAGGRLLEIRFGPGHLSARMTREHGVNVTGVALDPAMVVRARANAEVARNVGGPRPSFLVGDVASLAFPEGSFDMAVSTLSMPHWSDRAAGLVEIGRVLRASGPH